MNIRPLKTEDLGHLREFTDREIGAGYYSQSELEDIFKRSISGSTMCSLLLVDEQDNILGVRFSYPPGSWSKGKGSGTAGPGLNPQLWPHAIDKTGYFQSIFLASSTQGQGWGGRLSEESLKRLKAVGALGVVCHSWKESPNNSSSRYLSQMGFQAIVEHPLYWSKVDYNCTRCLKPPCQCTAIEMYLDLEKRA